MQIYRCYAQCHGRNTVLRILAHLLAPQSRAIPKQAKEPKQSVIFICQDSYKIKVPQIKRTMKGILFSKLEKIKKEISNLNQLEKDKAKKLLISADEIIDQFNKGKIKQDSELDLNDNDLAKLKKVISEIWGSATVNNIEVWPKATVTERVG